MDIEAVAHDTPDKIFTQPIDINKGVQDQDTRRIAELLGFKGKDIAEAQTQMKNLYELFIKEVRQQHRYPAAFSRVCFLFVFVIFFFFFFFLSFVSASL